MDTVTMGTVTTVINTVYIIFYVLQHCSNWLLWENGHHPFPLLFDNQYKSQVTEVWILQSEGDEEATSSEPS